MLFRGTDSRDTLQSCILIKFIQLAIVPFWSSSNHKLEVSHFFQMNRIMDQKSEVVVGQDIIADLFGFTNIEENKSKSELFSIINKIIL